MLYLVNESGVLLLDLKTGDMAALQEQVLSDFVAENASSREYDGDPSMLYPYRDGVYILTHNGLYWHELYGESIEPVIDGNFCTMNGRRRMFTGMALIETEAEPEFNLRNLFRENLIKSVNSATGLRRLFGGISLRWQIFMRASINCHNVSTSGLTSRFLHNVRHQP